jgi:hypothetical protein
VLRPRKLIVLNSPAVAIVSATVSMLATVLGLWVFALPAAVIALAFKLAAIHAMAGTRHAERCRDRFGLALLFDTVALLAVGPGLFDRAQVVVVLIGLLGLAGTFVAWLSASSRATAQRHRWGIEHRTATTRQPDNRRRHPHR